MQARLIEKGDGQVSDAILDYFKPYLEQKRGGTILEIGGAPGRYLAHFSREFDLQASAIDYSAEGCKQLSENFEKAELDITVIERDVLNSNAAEKEKADIVCSLGLIEHFNDPVPMIRKHADYLKDDGLLVMGVPNYGGIYEWFWKKLSPKLLSTHVLSTMKLEKWSEWQEPCGLEMINVKYVGGFSIGSLDKGEVNQSSGRKIIAKILRKVFKNSRIFEKVNHPYVAGYLLGTFRKKR